VGGCHEGKPIRRDKTNKPLLDSVGDSFVALLASFERPECPKSWVLSRSSNGLCGQEEVDWFDLRLLVPGRALHVRLGEGACAFSPVGAAAEAVCGAADALLLKDRARLWRES